MHRCILTSRSVWPLTHAFRTSAPSALPARSGAFASAAIKGPSPPAPIEPSQSQAHPLGAYYEAILHRPQPLPAEKPKGPPASAATSPSPSISASASEAAEPSASAKRGRKPKESQSAPAPSPSSSSSSSTTTTTAAPEDDAANHAPPSVQARARIVFGSRLAGPADRAAAPRRLVAGVLVPSRPEEPDNCCMGGCVHCVWDAYRDEMDAWAAAEAEAKPRAQEAEEDTGRDGLAGAAWALGRRGEGENASLARDFWDEELYKNVPVGIREFMKQEKRLKEKHREEGTAAG